MHMLKEIIRNLANNIILTQATSRGLFWSIFLASAGKGIRIMHGCRILAPGNVKIGKNVYINHNTDIYGQGGVEIGDYVLIGPNTNILSVNHAFSDWTKPITEQGITIKKVTIEEDVWICANVTVIPGVTIGKGSIIGANALVAKDVEPYSIMGGVPAKLIKKRFPDKILKNLLKEKRK